MRALAVGCGSIGRRHLRNLRALGVEDLHAFDPRPERREEAKAESGAEPCASLEEGLARAPNLVVVATPSSLHVEPALAAARRGCHLFIEKPLASDRAGLDDLTAEVEGRGLVALVGCNMRFHPAVRELSTRLRAGAIGRVVSARVLAASYLPDWHPWEDYRQGYSARADLGGGVILDGIHELDYLLDLLGPARAVTCVAGRYGAIEVETEDTAELIVELEAGALASVHLSYVQRAYRRGYLFSGTDGTLEWDVDHDEVRRYDAERRTWERSGYPPEDANEMYLRELRHLLACLRGDDHPAQDLRAARAALELALAAKESAALGRRVVLS